MTSPTIRLAPSVRPTFGAALALASSLLLGGCPLLSSATASSAASTPSALTVVQGNLQTVQAGRTLGSPIVLRVVDDNGRGVPKQAATLVVLTGGGTVTPATVVSDSLGEMRFNWTLGSATPIQTLQASVSGTVGTQVSAVAVFPSQIIVAQGQSQVGKIVTVLKNDVVVRVVGPSNQPMINVPVTLTVVQGGGGISPQSGVTNILGEFTTKWTMGAAAGPNTLTASSGTLPLATIAATATP